MNRTAKRWLIRTGILILILLLVVLLFKDELHKQARIYILGLQEAQAEEFGYYIQNVDQIEILSLEDAGRTDDSSSQKAMGYRVHKTSVVSGADAKPILDDWRSLKRARYFRGMCHDPAYVLRFYKNHKVMFETSICWHCHNYEWSGPFGIMFEYGFDADGEEAQALLELLKIRSPLD